MEIIIIYFFKYNYDNVKIIFDDEIIKNKIFKLFEKEKFIFLTKEVLDEKITEIYINYCPNIEQILNILKRCDNYIDYLNKINNNFDKIFNSIDFSQPLTEKFNFDFDVSQEDFNKLIDLHHSLLEKQKKIGKYILNFIPMIEKYFSLFNDKNSLDGLSSLEQMTNEELKIFDNKKIKDIHKKIIEKLKELLMNKINKKEIKGKKAIDIISKLEHHFNDETFNLDNKKLILNFIIDKFIEKDREMIKEYSNKKIWNLFGENEKNIFLEEIRRQNFKEARFLELLPEDSDPRYSKEIENIYIEIINKAIEKEKDKEVADENKDVWYFFYSIFGKTQKKKNVFSKILNYFKEKDMIRKNYIDIIFYNINGNKNNLHEDNLKEFIQFFNHFFKKGNFYLDNNKIMIPIYVLEKTKNNRNFQNLFFKQLQDYIIDEETIFSEEKKIKFLLLEKMVDKDFFEKEYKEKTKAFIFKVRDNRFNYTYKKLI